MNIEHTQRIADYQARLADLLAMNPLKYSDWSTTDSTRIIGVAGVYHFFEKYDDHIVSIYIGKGGFGRGKDWSLYERLKQHFQPSQKYALLGKASKATGLSPEQIKANFEEGNLYLQWLTFTTKSDSVTTNLEAELRWFECFAIAVLNPKYTVE